MAHMDLLRATVIGEAGEGEEIIYAHIGKLCLNIIFVTISKVLSITEPRVFHDTRAGIPVTVQRRFDVYDDVSKGH